LVTLWTLQLETVTDSSISSSIGFNGCLGSLLEVSVKAEGCSLQAQQLLPLLLQMTPLPVVVAAAASQ
jgi:hypothetical protein